MLVSTWLLPERASAASAAASQHIIGTEAGLEDVLARLKVVHYTTTGKEVKVETFAFYSYDDSRTLYHFRRFLRRRQPRPNICGADRIQRSSNGHVDLSGLN